MQREERRIEPTPPTMRLSPGPTAQRLSRLALQSGPISVIPRTLEPGVLKALDALPSACLPHIRARSIDAALRSFGFAPPWLSEWLSDDVVFLARLFKNLVGAERVLVRLEAIQDNACQRFHTDNVRFRLVTTYRGPGTEWLSSADASILQEDHVSLVGKILRLDRSQVAVMRGARGATADRPGLLHRSPRIAGSGTTRLFLAIDDAADHEH